MSIKTLKNWPQKLLIIGPNPFISQSSPDHSPHIMKSRDQTSVLLSVANSHYILIHLINDLNFDEVERPVEDYPGYKSAVLPAAKPAAKYYRSAGPGWAKPAAKPTAKPKKLMKGKYIPTY